MILGVISDTHGLLREEAVRALAGVSRIIHAGDIGAADVLERLARIAPVDAVRGNVDVEAWAGKLPEAATVEADGARIYVLHNVGDLAFDPAARGYAAVVSGHSHSARNEVRAGVLYLNPGSAGPRRFHLPVTVARLTVERGRVSAEVVTVG